MLDLSAIAAVVGKVTQSGMSNGAKAVGVCPDLRFWLHRSTDDTPTEQRNPSRFKRARLAWIRRSAVLAIMSRVIELHLRNEARVRVDDEEVD